ncbi:MAG: diacylglycerol kinase family lipid kinase [Bryobacteraceae bacterium]|nr:diacylglycerol kinase family lipid kinase [Bryobacteraceae bacterium]
MTSTATRTRAVIFVNASAGWDAKEDAPQKLEQWFAESGIEAQVEYVEKGVNLAEKAREAVIAGNDIVVAAGGDGTLSATASGLVGTEATFGVLPVGTLNHFARDLNLPLELEPAARVISAGHVMEVDVGEVNGKTFLNNAVLGLYPIFRAIRADLQKRGWPSKLSWIWGWVTALQKLPFYRMKLTVDGREVIRKTPYMIIANNKHAMQGRHIGARKSLQDGKLWIYVLRPQSRIALVWMALKVVFGVFRRQEYFDAFPATEVYIDTRSRRLGVSLDGEIHVMDTPLRFRSLPLSLRVFVPEP